MKQNKLSGLTLEELQKKRNSLKGIVLGILIAWVVIFGAVTYILLNRAGDTNNMLPMMMIPVLFVTTLIPLMVTVQQLNAEIKRRNPPR